MIQIRITGNQGFERIPGNLLIFQETAQHGSGHGPSHALSPERLSPVFPFGEYMYA